MSGIAELLAEHRALEERAERLMRIANLVVPDPAAIAGERWQMSKMLHDHCAHEQRIVYDPLLGSDDTEAVAHAWASHQEYGSLATRFSQYIADWPVTRIAREWIAFRLETARIVEALAARVTREEQLLYPHVERVLTRRAA